ncbi:MAG TPA: hypothetical protein VKG89_08485 [Solirubrobacterales bacterium]|nr:hypothetical protein [Solirubrobacterales bacterium]
MHNPLRSETDVFRAVVVIGVGAAAVIGLTLLTRPLFGAILLAVEVVAGLWALSRRAQGHLPHEAEIAHRGDPVYRVLVVANETVGGAALLEEIRNRGSGRRSEILVVVPALTSSALEHWASDVDRALEDARTRLDESLRRMDAAGIDARGLVGDHHEPNASIEDALRTFAADEVIISTHPPDRSGWLEGGVVERAREEIPLPITHVVVDLEAEARDTSSATQSPA